MVGVESFEVYLGIVKEVVTLCEDLHVKKLLTQYVELFMIILDSNHYNDVC